MDCYRNNKEIKIPDVQRELVWTKSQKQLLIDSILKEYDIPKIYFRECTEDNRKVYYVIDGQQRLNAVFDFLDDKFEMPKDSDLINGENIANKKYSEMSSSLQIKFQSRTLDVVHLIDYSDEEIDETFLRLQNGTPLKAAEKRRAIKGEMRNVIKELSKNDVFDKLCDFSDLHFAYEDITTKILKQIIEGPGSISAKALAKFYEQNSTISIDDPNCKKVKQAFNFLKKAFKLTANPHFKKYSIFDMSIITNKMLSIYDLNSYPTEFAKIYLQFIDDRIINAEKNEDEQDQKLIAYSNAARGDSLEFVEYRQTYLYEYFVQNMPYLEVKDPQRLFTPEQRAAIYRRGEGKCAICGCKVDENDFHADHIIPHCKGGHTTIANGQLLCSKCNLEKSDKIS